MLFLTLKARLRRRNSSSHVLPTTVRSHTHTHGSKGGDQLERPLPNAVVSKSDQLKQQVSFLFSTYIEKIHFFIDIFIRLPI